MSGQRRSPAERKKDRLGALLYLAEQDADAAKLLAAHGNRYAAYHCQQAVEKLIRALLLQHDIEPGLGHHLDVLIGRLPAGDPWKAILTPLHKYTPYATTYLESLRVRLRPWRLDTLHTRYRRRPKKPPCRMSLHSARTATPCLRYARGWTHRCSPRYQVRR
jgi:HEPN domain-containing protein